MLSQFEFPKWQVLSQFGLPKWQVLSQFGFTQYEVMLSTRPEKAIGSDQIWELATGALEGALKQKGWKYSVVSGRRCLQVRMYHERRRMGALGWGGHREWTRVSRRKQDGMAVERWTEWK